ncbi:DUF6883 domain-containing protein [Brevundimonas sp.]|jgi:hypothetical protein|uniref:DUF6883 domain-containing protein n=1 Tax=Brevundimonas sp. TaxID=1871086 RepID=UPI001855F88A|nr:DUF6883 domain-containing protein [Brevundimonas sp.]MBA4809064.1 hypothetical protein [Brevundimonas sp.]
MKLPGGERAVVPDGKIEAYCLSVHHPEGRHKARVFAAALGLTLADAPLLKRRLLEAARDADAVPVGETAFGTLYRVRFMLEYRGRAAMIRSGWIVGLDGAPRLTTAMVE